VKSRRAEVMYMRIEDKPLEEKPLEEKP